MTFAVNVTNGPVHHQLHQGGMTADSVERFNQFLEDVSLRCNPGQEVCFIITMRARTSVLHSQICHMNLKSNTSTHVLPFSIYLRMLLPCGNKRQKLAWQKCVMILQGNHSMSEWQHWHRLLNKRQLSYLQTGWQHLSGACKYTSLAVLIWRIF